MIDRLFVTCSLLAVLVSCHTPSAPVGSPTGARGTEVRGTPSPPLTPSLEPSTAGHAKTFPLSPATGHYFVRGGDTLYSIAWQSGLDYRDLGSWNRIVPPYTIYPGQRLRLTSPDFSPSPPLHAERVGDKKTGASEPPASKVVSPPLAAAQPVVSAPEVKPQPKSEAKAKSAQAVSKLLRWGWPTEGKLLKLKSLTAKRGLQIGGALGQDVIASAGGDVVHSGSGILGYGKLIIIKHSDEFLSAYAHNSELLVTEGDQVKLGQPIARMGLGIGGNPVLHFEIIKDGKSANPLKYLPKERG